MYEEQTTGELDTITVYYDGDLSCQDNMEDMLQNLIENGEPVAIGPIRFEYLIALVDAEENQNVDLSVGGTVGLEITDPILDAVGDINMDINGVFCGNLVEWVMTYATFQFTGIPVDLDNIPLRLLQRVKLWEQANIIDESDLCMSDITIINDDYAHIFMEQATISDKWSGNYINWIGSNSDMHWYAMLHAVLHNSQVPYPFLNEHIIEQEYINTAPCLGPWDNPNWPPSLDCAGYYAAPNAISGWRGANRLFHPGLIYLHVRMSWLQN